MLFPPFNTFAVAGVGVLAPLALGTDDAEPAGKMGVCKAGPATFSVVCLPRAQPWGDRQTFYTYEAASH